MISKAKKWGLGAAAAAAMSVSVAQATPVTWHDVYNPADIYLAGNSSISFAHDVTDTVGSTPGFRPGIDSISSASLTIWLYDDAFFGDLPYLGDGQEAVQFSFDGLGWSAPTAVGGNAWFEDAFDFSLANLLSDGKISVSLRGAGGDFMFDRSVLTVHGDTGAPTNVPEPATLALFGLGLLGAGMAGRRKNTKTP